jgi:hypothetical protein
MIIAESVQILLIVHASSDIMRILLENGPIDAFSSPMANDISLYASFSIMAVTTGLVYYALLRILNRSRNKPFPRVFQSSAFNFLLVSSLMAIAIILLRGIDLIRMFAMATEPIAWIVEDYGPLIAVGLASTIVLMFAKRPRAG